MHYVDSYITFTWFFLLDEKLLSDISTRIHVDVWETILCVKFALSQVNPAGNAFDRFDD